MEWSSCGLLPSSIPAASSAVWGVSRVVAVSKCHAAGKDEAEVLWARAAIVSGVKAGSTPPPPPPPLMMVEPEDPYASDRADREGGSGGGLAALCVAVEKDDTGGGAEDGGGGAAGGDGEGNVAASPVAVWDSSVE